MRYRVGEAPVDALTATDPWLTFTVVLGLALGVLLTWLGVQGRQTWLVVWSGGLVVVSVASLAWFALAPA